MDLAIVYARDCELSVRTMNCLRLLYGEDVTLADLETKTDVELARTPHLGRKSIKEIREVIASVKAMDDPVKLTERCTTIADQVVPQYRNMGLNYSCTGHWANRWQAAWDAACIALGGNPADYVVKLDERARTRTIAHPVAL